MSITKTLGGDRLGSGNKNKVEMHGFERSTHDLGKIWRSTMSPGTLVPFLSELALPGDTWDINLGANINTHPTIGPLFGSFKCQLDIFQCPIRLYNSMLHNNMLGIGMKMSQVKLPKIQLDALPTDDTNPPQDLDNSQINPSSLLAYLGIRGVGISIDGTQARKFNAIPILAYWEIYKNYYANKQEEIGAVIHTPSNPILTTVTSITVAGYPVPFETGTTPIYIYTGGEILINYSGSAPDPATILIQTDASGNWVTALDLTSNIPYTDDGVGTLSGVVSPIWNGQAIRTWKYRTATDLNQAPPEIATFDLANIDTMRQYILQQGPNIEYVINTAMLQPYSWLSDHPNGIPNVMSSQEGLALKTYQSDLLNNWIQTEWIDGPGGISEVTAIDTSGGSFTIDTLLLSRKVYDMLNRIAASGGTYDDWLDVQYDHTRYLRAESPMYMGGLIKEVVFQEVVSNSGNTDQPLGTIAGRGTFAPKHKGGNITIKVDEPSYIIGIVSLTPRLDYSQGNKWDMYALDSMEDLHVPMLDQIGFQELITEQMAWWDTHYTPTGWVQRSAGKQPAWINYMTNINEVRGNFAIKGNEMFMTLNRMYEPDHNLQIVDLTTYIDPVKYNQIFAQTSLDAQNFWVQIGVDMTVRRKMSAKLMPNL